MNDSVLNKPVVDSENVEIGWVSDYNDRGLTITASTGVGYTVLKGWILSVEPHIVRLTVTAFYVFEAADTLGFATGTERGLDRKQVLPRKRTPYGLQMSSG